MTRVPMAGASNFVHGRAQPQEPAQDDYDRWALQAGYPMVEGSADVDEVYAFAWLHYGVVSVVWRPELRL